MVEMHGRSATRVAFRRIGIALSILGTALMAGFGGEAQRLTSLDQAAAQSKPASSKPECPQRWQRDLSPAIRAASFWDADRGIIGTASPVEGPPAKVSQTADGAATFSKIAEFPNAQIDWLETAGDTDAWAVLCEGAQPGRARFVHSADSGQTWVTMPLRVTLSDGRVERLGGKFTSPSFSTPADGVASIYDAGFYRLLVTRDGGRSWIRRRGPPCFDGMRASSVRPGVIRVLCIGEGSTGGQGRWVYASRDDGRTWRELVGVAVFEPCERGICEHGYPGSFSFAPDGTGLITSSAGAAVSISTNGGRRWRDVSIDRRNLIGETAAEMISANDAFALYPYAPRRPKLFMTYDRGASWSIAHSFRRQAGD